MSSREPLGGGNVTDQHPEPAMPAARRSTAVATRPDGVARPIRLAVLLVLPYLIIGFAWAFSNPPGAAPDESDHLTKALAAARLEIGVPFTGPPPSQGLVDVRNASISRIVRIPAELNPQGYQCFAFDSKIPASCLPAPTYAPGFVDRATPVGAYPVFWYVPLGLAANLADTPAAAFYLARAMSVLLSSIFLFLGVWHLVRWLGRWAALGLTVAITPMSVFAAASVSTSGIEIMSAIAVAAVVVVASRIPYSLANTGTLALLTVAGASLVLSRQLGAVAFAVFAVVALCRGGAAVLWDQLRRGRWPAITCVVVIVLSGVAILIWERRYDHPALTGAVFSQDAVGFYLNLLFHYVTSGVGNFGWLDTSLPGLMFAVWIVLAVVTIFGALLVGSRADRWTIGLSLMAVAAVAYVVQSTVFTPILAGLQGRHMLPLFCLVPMLSGVVLAEKLRDSADRTVLRRFAVVASVSAGVLQAFAVFVNARRYSVGTDGPIVFIDHPQWEPPLGWIVWLILAVIGGGWIATNGIVGRHAATRESVERLSHVER